MALTDLAPLHSELTKLTDFAVQIYKTLADALNGHYPHWRPNARPIYPIIVTLEDWYVFGRELDAEIEARLRLAFRSQSLDEEMLLRYPITFCAVSEFERLMPIIASKGVATVMTEKVNAKRRLWLLHSAMMDAFPEDYRKARTNLFPEALATITGEAP